jgi:hypothetical protein
MPYVACPSCGERGKIPPTLVGARIKCKKCGISFNVAPSAAKAAATAGGAAGTDAATASAEATGTPHEGIAIEGLDSAAWAVASDTSDGLKAPIEQDQAPPEAVDGNSQFVAQEATGFKEYKLLTSKDKVFEGKFDLVRLEEALNYYARQGWVVKAMSTPHVKGFSGGPQEEIVVLLER